MSSLRTDYLSGALSPAIRRRNIELAVIQVKMLKDKHPWLERIACSGWSGMLIAPAVADACDLRLVVVGKNENNRHSHHNVEGYMGGSYVIVDDCYETGETVKRIQHEVYKADRDECGKAGLCIGIVFYGSDKRFCREDGSRLFLDHEDIKRALLSSPPSGCVTPTPTPIPATPDEWLKGIKV